MDPNAKLTQREAQIVELTAWGAAAKEIADKLFISIHTVNNHLQKAKSTIGVQKSSEISAWYFCTNFHISMDLSPIRRQVLAIILLMIITPFELTTFSSFVRIRRVETCRTCRRVRKGEDELPEFQFID